jgi:hypothetical protein
MRLSRLTPAAHERRRNTALTSQPAVSKIVKYAEPKDTGTERT